MITIEHINKIAIKELTDAINNIGMDGIFKIVPGGVLCTEGDEDYIESASIEYEIHFTYGNIKHIHSFVIGFNDSDGVGFEYGEDGDFQSITYGSTMSQLYFDLALKDLDDKYLT